MRGEQVTIFNTDVSDAADDLLKAHKEFVDAKDRLECTRKHLAGLLKRQGLVDKQFIIVDKKKLSLKEGTVTEDSISISNVKE